MCGRGREWSRRATQVSDLAASCPEKSRTSSLSVQASPFKETLSVPLNRSWPAFRANTCYERRRFTRSNDPAWNDHDLDLLEDHRFKAVLFSLKSFQVAYEIISFFLSLNFGFLIFVFHLKKKKRLKFSVCFFPFARKSATIFKIARDFSCFFEKRKIQVFVSSLFFFFEVNHTKFVFLLRKDQSFRFIRSGKQRVELVR